MAHRVTSVPIFSREAFLCILSKIKKSSASRRRELQYTEEARKSIAKYYSITSYGASITCYVPNQCVALPDSVVNLGIMAFWAGIGKFVESLVRSDPLEGYDQTDQYTVPDCTIEIIFGHYTKTPHTFNTGPSSGVTVHGCAAGGMTIGHLFNPDVVVPPKGLIPFPGSRPLSTDYVSPDDALAEAILADYQAALDYAQELLEASDCPSITVSIKFVGFEDNWYDNGIKRHMKIRGVTEQSQVVTR
ncbi:MAG: hypothetical protein HOF76_02305 [Candidatus Scalindua sp.]|nr:hypothetical protein [Candidatus Scalindua sp.]